LPRYVVVSSWSIIRFFVGIESFERPATVGVVAARLHDALLGQAGFLQ
jgi:hypothetical protein